MSWQFLITFRSLIKIQINREGTLGCLNYNRHFCYKTSQNVHKSQNHVKRPLPTLILKTTPLSKACPIVFHAGPNRLCYCGQGRTLNILFLL